MSSSQELYKRLIDTIGSLVNVSPTNHLNNWVWIVVGIIQSNSLALSQTALHIPSHANAESRVATIRRWLQDCQVNVWTFYQPVLGHVLAGWRTTEATVILDGIAVVIGCRVTICLANRHAR